MWGSLFDFQIRFAERRGHVSIAQIYGREKLGGKWENKWKIEFKKRDGNLKVSGNTEMK